MGSRKQAQKAPGNRPEFWRTRRLWRVFRPAKNVNTETLRGWRELCAETQTFQPETREPDAIVREILTLVLSSLSKSTPAVSALEHSVQLSHRHTPSSWPYARFSCCADVRVEMDRGEPRDGGPRESWRGRSCDTAASCNCVGHEGTWDGLTRRWQRKKYRTVRSNCRDFFRAQSLCGSKCK